MKLPDVMHRGSVEWSRAMGVDISFSIMKFLRDVIGCEEVIDPFCGTGTALVCANALGMHATGCDKSAKRCKKAIRAILKGNRLVLNDDKMRC